MPEIATARLQQTGPIRRENLFGREHLVVPTVAVREMVLSNNIGDMLVTAEAIEASLAAWNFTPVTIGHPTERGTAVSARTPERINSRAVGIMMSARLEDRSLKADVFIDPEQAKRVSGGAEVIAELEVGNVPEVSTGFGGTFERESGTFEGRAYNIVARTIQPDHFAIGIEKGACSVGDGCGLGVNKEDDMDEEKVAENLWEKLKGLIATNKERRMKNRDEVIAALAANEAVPFSPCTLKAMNADELAHVASAVELDVDGIDLAPAKEPEPKNEPATNEEAPAWAKPLFDGLSTVTKEVGELKEAAAPAVNEHRKERERLIQTLAANDRCPFDEDELKDRGIDELRKLDAMAANRDYSGRGGPRSATADNLPDIDFGDADWHQQAEA